MRALDLVQGGVAVEPSGLAEGRCDTVVTALGEPCGCSLDRALDAVLFSGVRRAGQLAVARLRDRYAAIAEGLDPEGIATRSHLRLVGQSVDRSTHWPALGLAADPAVACALPDGAVGVEYLASLVCFRRFDDAAQVAQIVDGLAVRWAARGEWLDREGALLLVARGAVEVSVRVGGNGGAQRVRLAGPGRFVGHPGVLDDGPSPVVARARERSVLIELPRERVNALLNCPTAEARHFTAALYEDVACAAQQAERVMARTVASTPADTTGLGARTL